MRAARSSLDLLVVIALALVGLVAALIPLDAWIRALLLAPLVLAVSGYAILAALFPNGGLPRGERLVYAVGLSIAATTLGGIAVQIVFDLDRSIWALLLTVITAGAAALALRRRGWSWPGSRTATAGQNGSGLALPGVLPILVLTAALAIAVVAVAISSAGAKRERDAYRFTALWMQPVERASGPGSAVAIGVDNRQGATARYRLVIRQGRTTLVRRKLVLPAGGRFRLRVPTAPIAPTEPVAAELHRNGELLRRVNLESESTP
jgi:uncharacterized membrane protein